MNEFVRGTARRLNSGVGHETLAGRGLFWYQADAGKAAGENSRPEPGGSGNSVADSNAPSRLVIRLGKREELDTIQRLRHEVYARELGQYAVREDRRLTDALDAFSIYIVVCNGEEIVGFLSITPPGYGMYGVDKYLKRDQLPFPVDDKLYEVRVLTIPQASRRGVLALLLMYASFRWVESHGGTRIMAMGRREIRSMHNRVGLRLVGPTVQAGAVTYGLLQATMPEIHEALHAIRDMLLRAEAEVDWQLDFPYRTPAA